MDTLDGNKITERLRACDITPTRQRVVLAQMLFSCDQHISAEQLQSRLASQGEVVSKATVYNTLGLFTRKGLVREIVVDPMRIFYDSNTRPHHHFYNVDTGELSDIAPDAVSLDRLPDLPRGTSAERVDVIIRLRNGRGEKQAH